MSPENRGKFSRFLTFVLRRSPETLGLTLNKAAWVGVDDLLAAAAAHGRNLSRSDLEEIVRLDDKGRFAFSEDGVLIRANQGHSSSLGVDLGYCPTPPPDVLWHGTTAKVVPLILADGLRPISRQHVHLSKDTETAQDVAARRSPPHAILRVEAKAMANDGLHFLCSTNGVWLTDHVPARYIRVESWKGMVSETTANLASYTP